MTTKYIPDGYHSITPSLCVDGAHKLIEFLTDVFGAKERMRMEGPGGKIMHAEFNIGDSAIMVADAMPEWPAKSNALYVYVEDVDAVYKRAVQAGARNCVSSGCSGRPSAARTSIFASGLPFLRSTSSR